MAPKTKKTSKTIAKSPKKSAKKTGGKGSGKDSPKKGKKKDGAKRPKNAFMFFSSENREIIMKKLKLTPKDIGPIGKGLGEAWAKMTDAEKKPYVAKAEADKARYEKAK